jgi:hypothetical protein
MDHVTERDHGQSAANDADGEQDEQDAGRLQGKDSCLQQKYGLAREADAILAYGAGLAAGAHFTHCIPRRGTDNHRAS